MATTYTYNASMQNGTWTVDMNESSGMGDVVLYSGGEYSPGPDQGAYYDRSFPPSDYENRYYGGDSYMYDSEAFAGEADAYEMGGGAAGRAAGLGEMAADAAAYDLAGAAMLGGLGAAGIGWYVGQYSAYSDDPAPATYNWGPEWTVAFSAAPKTFATVLGKPGPLPYFKAGVNPAPAGRNGVSSPSGPYLDGSVTSNANLGEDVIISSTTGFWSGTYRVPWGPGLTNVPPGNDSQLSYDKRTRPASGGNKAVTVRHASFPQSFRGLNAPPASVSDPLSSRGEEEDHDHPRNVRPRWRPGPQDWPNVPRHLPNAPAPSEPPPEGGTSGGAGSSGDFSPQGPPLPGVVRYSSDEPSYKVPAHSYSPTPDNSWEKENDWHLLVPDYAIKILMDHGIYEKTGFFKSPEGLENLYRILAKSIPDHPCVGLTGSARVKCVMQNLDRVSWRHFAGQVGREAAKVEEPGVVRTPLPNWDRRAKKAFKAVRAVHNAVALGVKRSRVFSNRKGMF